jgi:hypothetical protein
MDAETETKSHVANCCRAAIRPVIGVFLLAAALAVGSNQAVAAPFEDARAAFKRGDYATQMRIMRPLADRGDARAQYEVGAAYFLGFGEPKAFARAAFWYRKAAEQGNPDAQNNLGSMYLSGRGVPKDYALSLSWLTKSAEQGHPGAALTLGWIYLSGKGVPVDLERSYVWCSISALGSSHLPADIGSFIHDQAIAGRDGVAAKLTPAQIAEGDRQIAQWSAEHPVIPSAPWF